MDYWNQPNFEGLRALSAELARHAGFGGLSDYCRLRDAGLRRDAFAALDAFLAAANTWEPPRAREAAERILTLHFGTPKCHQFLSEPLKDRFVLPVLLRWAADAPADVAPARWLGLLQRDPDHLARALEGDPGDVDVRRMLIGLSLSFVDFATHHLGESVFIGDVADASYALDRAASLIDTAPDKAPLSDLADEVSHFRQLVADWQAYQADPEGTFPEWCAARGRQRDWAAAYYYDA